MTKWGNLAKKLYFYKIHITDPNDTIPFLTDLIKLKPYQIRTLVIHEEPKSVQHLID